MKPAVICISLASATFFGLTAGALATCTENQPGAGVVDPYAPSSDVPYYYPENSTSPVIYPTRRSSSPNVASPSAPTARITVVDAGLPGGSRGRGATPAVPTARLTVINETPADQAKVETDNVAKALETLEPAADKVAAEAAAAKVESETLDPALKDLVGTWMAVARFGDGELTTVELQLDDRGWAKLTVPGADGKPSTVKRRIELEDEELKLTGPDDEMTLGKLIDVNSRQLVLARADGQITFVRP